MSGVRGNAWIAFWQTVIRFQSEKLTPWLALRNTIGVTVPLAVGAATGNVAGGIAVAMGALNVCYSDGQEPYRQRARRMVAASCLVALALAAGQISGNHTGLAIVVATTWAFAAGMLVSLSPIAADLGVISLVTLVVYAAVPATPQHALTAGALAFGGGIFQTLLSLAFWPLRRYAPEARALGALYRELGRAASKPFEATLSPPASTQSTLAYNSLRSLDTDRSTQSERLRLLLSQAERMRLSLLMLARLDTRILRETPDAAEAVIIDSFRQVAARMLTSIGEALFAGKPADAVPECQQQLESATTRLRDMADSAEPQFAAMVRDARFQMDALTGQLRAAVDLAAYSSEAGLAAYDRRELRQPWSLRLSSTVATLRANLNLDSAAFRHAVRLAVCVGLGDAVGRNLSLDRSYWLPMTIAIVLKPDFSATFSRGVLRLAGTFAGLVFATGLFHILPHGVGAEVAAMAVLMYCMRWLGPANYGVFVTCVTALIVLLLALAGVTPKDVMGARALNTVAGGLIALVAYAVWPTWERTQVAEAAAQLLDAYRAYFRAIRDSYEHPQVERSPDLDHTRMPARLARSNLEASIERLVAEPGTSADTASLLSGILASSHRLVHAMMALEAGLSSSHPVPPRAAFAPFANDVELTLYYLAAGLRGSHLEREGLPDVREAHHALTHSGDALTERYALVNVETDRITNSVNTLAEQVLRYLGR